ncbi:MAG: LCP family protein [Eubacteriales bacterium]|nr:LCP family protein [Eubacteriales bacterium]
MKLKNKEKQKDSIRLIPESDELRVIAATLLVFEAGLVGLLSALDVLPTKFLLVILVILTLADLGILLLLSSRKNVDKRIVGLICVFVILIVTTMGGYYLVNTLDTLSRISTVQDKGLGTKVTGQPFNVYISGVDFWGDIEEVSRSDVNMIVTVNPNTRQILLTSIPRDAYITLHTYQQPDKLTHTGVYGIDETTSTVEDWLGIKIDYYVRANFNMAMALVNAMDGVDVYSDYDFKSSISKYKYKKGWNYLTGKQALYFARERKSFKDSDQQRIKNQQRVVKAMIRKLTTSKTLLTNYTDLLDAVEGYMQTDMSQKEITSMIKLQLNDMSRKWKIDSIAISGEETMMGTYSMGMERPLTVNITDKESEKRATTLIKIVQNPENMKIVIIKDDKSKKNNLKDENL